MSPDHLELRCKLSSLQRSLASSQSQKGLWPPQGSYHPCASRLLQIADPLSSGLPFGHSIARRGYGSDRPEAPMSQGAFDPHGALRHYPRMPSQGCLAVIRRVSPTLQVSSAASERLSSYYRIFHALP